MCAKCKATCQRIRGSGPLREMERACANGKTRKQPDYLGLRSLDSICPRPRWLDGSGIPRSDPKLGYQSDDRCVRAFENGIQASKRVYWFDEIPTTPAARKAELGRQLKRLAGNLEYELD